MSEQKINVELLNRIKAHILAEPRRVRMEAWVVSTHMTEEDRDRARFSVLEELYAEEHPEEEAGPEELGFTELLDFPACGTVACIAGWGAILTQPNPDDALKDPELLHGLYSLSEWESAARFGVDMDAAERLFHVVNWPDDLAAEYEAADSPAERASVVANRIDRFIKTKGAE